MMALLAGSRPVEERCQQRLGKLGGADQPRPLKEGGCSYEAHHTVVDHHGPNLAGG